LQGDQAESAEAICADMLTAQPNDANVLCLSAKALTALQKFPDAKARIEKAISLYPKFARPHEVNGELLMAQGNLPDAVDAFQMALKLDPGLQRSRIKLGQVFLHLGRTDDAQALKEEFMELDQDNKDIAKAVELEKEEKFAEAEQIYRQILTRHPDNVTAIRLWAQLGIKQKQFAEAEKFLRQAVKVSPGYSRAWNDLCGVQLEQENYDDVIQSANTLIKLKPHSFDGYIWLAAGTAASGKHEEAIGYYDKAIEIEPNHVGAMCGKGNACRAFGDQPGAISAYKKSIEVNPLYAEAYWNLANLKTFRFEDDEVDTMLSLLEDERITQEGIVQLNNALGLEFEGRKEYDRSFEFIDACNKIRRETEFYDRVENEEKVDLSLQVFTQQFFEEHGGHGNPDPAPIFIIGLPRSGSTLLEQILSSHSLVDGTHELAELGRTIRSNPTLTTPATRYPISVKDLETDDYRKLGEEYIERASHHRGDRPFFTDKNPNNFIHVGVTSLILPNAKFINARRHPLDSCYGSYKQLFASGQPFTYDLVELGEYYVQYQRIMDHWHTVLPGKILDVHYEEVVADLEGQVRRILDYCELDWEESCARFYETDRSVKSASSEQVRKPIYKTSVNTWRHYESHLEDLIETLEPVLKKLPKRERPIRFS